MVWAYVEDIDRYTAGRIFIRSKVNNKLMFRFVDSLTWRTYSEIFKKGIWTASAFKVLQQNS